MPFSRAMQKKNQRKSGAKRAQASKNLGCCFCCFWVVCCCWLLLLLLLLLLGGLLLLLLLGGLLQPGVPPQKTQSPPYHCFLPSPPAALPSQGASYSSSSSSSSSSSANPKKHCGEDLSLWPYGGSYLLTRKARLSLLESLLLRSGWLSFIPLASRFHSCHWHNPGSVLGLFDFTSCYLLFSNVLNCLSNSGINS